MIAIVDYGLGNVGAFANVYKRLNIKAVIARTARDLDGATHVVLPGVGAFDHAMDLLNGSGMRESLDQLAGSRDTRILGICVGMQILADLSDEGSVAGLGWIGGSVKAFANEPASAQLPLPHMGWNDVRSSRPSTLLKGMEEDARFYFLHSYFFECKERDDAVADASYGIRFACAVQRGGVSGVQFHPEKSHHWGVNLLRNFAET